MAEHLSRSFRIKLLLVIDTAFFFLELFVGYYVGSLALVADSFHMLNDVCSLLVALYAIHYSGKKERPPGYSYGWQRAEVLGALINGVFLLALCFSIFLEAIQRVFAPVWIYNPLLIVTVGSMGLASNIVGLLLFHEHGHAHGGGHSHGHSHSHSHSHSLPPIKNSATPSQSDPNHDHDHHHHPVDINQGQQSASANEQTPLLLSCSAPHTSDLTRQASSGSISSYESTTSQVAKSSRRHTLISVHPAQTRNNILRAAEQQRDQLTHQQHFLNTSYTQNKSGTTDTPDVQPSNNPQTSHSHHHHHHNHSHSHMNMRGIFLHALGDALGNVGVILTGLLIWFVPFREGSWVIYADPAISLIITAIIFTSALPLVRSASLILLQGTPSHVDLSRVQKSLEAIEGVRQVHELHIWSLSELKLVASVHVLIQNQNDFVTISGQIRKCLHDYGIHSSTIQPEIVTEDRVNGNRTISLPPFPRASTRASSMVITDTNDIIGADGCLQQCDETCDQEACCPPGSIVSRASVAVDLPSSP